MSHKRKFQRNQTSVAATATVTQLPLKQPPVEVEAESAVPADRKRFAFVMTCMSRLDHVKQSVPKLLENQAIDGKNNFLVFVDYYCPQHSGRWVAQNYGPRVHVIDMSRVSPLPPGAPPPAFNKPTALNSGALFAVSELGADYLVFIDADTLATPGLLSYLFNYVSLGQFYIFAPSHKAHLRDLTGFLALHKRYFVRVNGYDVGFKGWGAEDLDMRVRLYLYGKTPSYEPKGALKDPHRYTLSWGEIPHILASSIPHEDDRRVANYEHKDKDDSHELNLNLLCNNIFNLLGFHPVDLHESPIGPSIRRLLGMEVLPFTRD